MYQSVNCRNYIVFLCYISLVYTLSTVIYHFIGIYYRGFRNKEETTKYHGKYVHMKDDVARHLVSLICSILVIHVAIIRPLDGKTLRIYM